jgi:hypothetical protein
MEKKVKDITFHYTNEQMVKDLIKLVPFEEKDVVLDAGSGKNKVWYKNIPKHCLELECELEDGCDFLKWDKKVDWVIGNPPFDIGWKFTEKAIDIADKGIAFLGSIKFFNQFTSLRLEKMKEKGFELQHIRVVADKRWFGRYYFLIFEKKKGILSWERKTY